MSPASLACCALRPAPQCRPARPRTQVQRNCVVLPCLHFLYCDACVKQRCTANPHCPACNCPATGFQTLLMHR